MLSRANPNKCLNDTDRHILVTLRIYPRANQWSSLRPQVRKLIGITRFRWVLFHRTSFGSCRSWIQQSFWIAIAPVSHPTVSGSDRRNKIISPSWWHEWWVRRIRSKCDAESMGIPYSGRLSSSVRRTEKTQRNKWMRKKHSICYDADGVPILCCMRWWTTAEDA